MRFADMERTYSTWLKLHSCRHCQKEYMEAKEWRIVRKVIEMYLAAMGVRLTRRGGIIRNGVRLPGSLGELLEEIWGAVPKVRRGFSPLRDKRYVLERFSAAPRFVTMQDVADMFGEQYDHFRGMEPVRRILDTIVSAGVAEIGVIMNMYIIRKL